MKDIKKEIKDMLHDKLERRHLTVYQARNSCPSTPRYGIGGKCNCGLDEDLEELSEDIVKKIIPQVLKEMQQTKMAKTRGLITDNHLFANGYNQAIDGYKKKAKDLFDIDIN